MTNIKIMETVWDIRSLYANANSKATRGLLGYMMKTGRTDNLILGGAFSLLRDIEACDGLYKLIPCTSRQNVKEIVAVAEAARANVFKRFAINKQEINRVRKQIEDIM